ncbi:MAG TPA: hypothetical protein VMP68_04290 [Candidatus Eisenbacteria bacterium]|nr:hypothetical protein [Candidatus Eisenbacteria bacterium]
MVDRDKITCDQVCREISNYLEGDIAPSVRTSMDQHFVECARCRSVLEGTRNVIRLYSDERMIDVPAGFGKRLEKRLARNARTLRPTWSSWSAWLIPVAALALFAGGLRWASSLTTAHPLQSQHAQPATRIPPEMTVVVSTGAKEFHVPGCPFIHNKNQERTLTAREAVREGYVPCVRCMRKYLETASNGARPSDSITIAAADDDDDNQSGSTR